MGRGAGRKVPGKAGPEADRPSPFYGVEGSAFAGPAGSSYNLLIGA
jgi:hypothetical protein